MIDLEETLQIHQLLLREFGGAAGVRDEGLLKAALARPAGGFGEAEFYQTPEERRARCWKASLRTTLS